MSTGQTANTTAERFSDTIRSATFGDHERAAVSGFMAALFGRDLPLSAYRQMVAEHHYAYTVLEGSGDALVDHPVAGPFVDEALRRLPALEADLVSLAGADWRDELVPCAATVAYCERMSEVCVASPERFVAHHYTRYMGDLSGGQMIGELARDVYGLAPGAGAAFYEFPGIADTFAYKEGYRRRLDTAAWSPDERDALLDEVRIAYGLNTDVFADLGRTLAAGGFE